MLPDRQPAGRRRERLLLRLVLASVLAGVGCGAADAQGYVYWSDNGPGIASNGSTLGRANNDGSAVTHSLLTGAGAPGGIALDGEHVYWADTQQASIGRAHLDGSGADDTFVANATGGSASSPVDVALDGTYIYWTDGARYIGRAKIDGEDVEPHFIDAGTNSYPFGIAVVDGTIYFTEFSQILSVAATGGTPTPLVTLPAQSAPTALAAAGGYLYWSALNLDDPSPSGSIGRALIGGGDLEESFIPNLQYPTGVATDGTEIYWVDHTPGLIGRALLGSSGATNVQPSFASDPGGPWGVAINALVDPTETSVSCTPSSVLSGDPTSCTATVSDSASSATPTGTVVFSGNGSTFFSGSSSCTLTALPAGGASCVAGAEPLNAGTIPIDAAYGGDPVHSASAGSTTVCDGSAAQCGAGTGGTGGSGGSGAGSGGSSGSGGAGNGNGSGNSPVKQCVVPKLAGRTLAQARKLLALDRCALGKVTKTHTGHGHKLASLVVGSQRPAAGRRLALGAKVALGLGLLARKSSRGQRREDFLATSAAQPIPLVVLSPW